MSADQISTAIQNISYFTAVRESGLAYPVLLSSHLTMIAVFGGLILLTDLRLLNVAMRNIPASVVVTKTRPWKHVGLTVMILLGIHLGGAKFHDYYDNPYFLMKMSLLVCVFIHAMVFRKGVYRNPAALDSPGGPTTAAKVAATLSLVIWVSILSCGRLIAYWENPSNPSEQAPRVHSGQVYGRGK
jgi:hypothetical protein